MDHILVTGGTGFIGSNLVRALVQRGHKVRVFDNNFRGNSKRLNDIREQTEFVSGDIRIYENVKNAMKGIDTVFHLAYINGTKYFYSNPELVLDVAVRGQLNVIDGSVSAGVKTLVYASSSEVYQTPPLLPTPEAVPLIVPSVQNPRYSYGGGKIISELLLLHYAGDAISRRIIFRPHNVYGPNMGFEHVIPQIIEKIFIASNGFTRSKAEIQIQGTGTETRAFCYVDDAVEQILLCADAGNDSDIFHVGREEEITIRTLIEAIGNACGLRVSIQPGSSPEGATPRRCPDISKLHRLGYTPKVSLKQGLARTVNWYRNVLLNPPVAAEQMS